uniref:TIR domain-containing protein n=1 Tax=Branchiostoma floridae TaxID=7739 RepID=C3ZSU2_BRAFL|eukprot:XP_002588483.1 hypothetical protein BRAFLDRAFT_63431 [Branchiostoma floridae]
MAGHSHYEYDFVLLYHEDDQDAAFELLESVEKNFSFRGFFWTRDAVLGKSIFDNLQQSLELSRNVLCLLTPRFVDENWGNFQIENAVLNRLLSEKRKNVVSVMLEECTVPLALQDTPPLKPTGQWYWSVLYRSLVKNTGPCPVSIRTSAEKVFKAVQPDKDKAVTFCRNLGVPDVVCTEISAHAAGIRALLVQGLNCWTKHVGMDGTDEQIDTALLKTLTGGCSQ